MELFDIMQLRAVTEPIDRILSVLRSLVISIFQDTNDGYFRMLVSTILNNEYLYLGLILLICGFVVGILKRLFTV